jgi:hypothetical protein
MALVLPTGSAQANPASYHPDGKNVLFSSALKNFGHYSPVGVQAPVKQLLGIGQSCRWLLF